MYPDLGDNGAACRMYASASIDNMSDPNTAPAGWYDDGSGAMRYWDGSAWTEHTAPKPATASAAPDEAASAPASGSGPATAPPFAPIEQTSPTSATAAPTYSAASSATAPRTDSAFAPAPDSTGAKPHVLGIIALAVAVLGFIFACIPGALIVGWILLPIAFVLAIVALFLKGRKWPAIAALVTSIVGTIVGAVVFFAVVATSFEEAFGPVEGSQGQSSDTGADGAEEPAPADELDEAPVGNLAFGDTMVWDDGVELGVSAPEPFTPTEYASGADLPNNIVFTITITNNSDANLEPLAYSRLSSGGQEGSQIFDIDNPAGDISMAPTTVILPGQSVTWKEAWSVADPASLTMQIAPSWDYEDAIFTTE